MTDKRIHRANSNARPMCGVESGRISTSGVMLTCPECRRLSDPVIQRQAALQRLTEAAERFRATR